MDHPRLLVSFRPQTAASGSPAGSAPVYELDVTSIILNADAEVLAVTIAENPSGSISILDEIEDDIIRQFPVVQMQAVDRNEYCRISANRGLSPYEFFQKCGIEQPEKLTEQDLKRVREDFGIPDALTIPNGRRFFPESNAPTFISGTILVDLNDLVGQHLEDVLDHISEELTGSCVLSDFSYKVAGSNGTSIRLLVSGDAAEILECEAQPVEAPSSP